MAVELFEILREQRKHGQIVAGQRFGLSERLERLGPAIGLHMAGREHQMRHRLRRRDFDHALGMLQRAREIAHRRGQFHHRLQQPEMIRKGRERMPRLRDHAHRITRARGANKRLRHLIRR